MISQCTVCASKNANTQCTLVQSLCNILNLEHELEFWTWIGVVWSIWGSKVICSMFWCTCYTRYRLCISLCWCILVFICNPTQLNEALWERDLKWNFQLVLLYGCLKRLFIDFLTKSHFLLRKSLETKCK